MSSKKLIKLGVETAAVAILSGLLAMGAASYFLYLLARGAENPQACHFSWRKLR